MGISANVNIGFFIQLNKTILVKKIEVNACVNEGCNKFHIETKSKFCGECGSEIKKASVEESLNLEDSECYTHKIVTDKYEDVVYFNSYVPNVLTIEISTPYSIGANIMYDSLVSEISIEDIQQAKKEIQDNSKINSLLQYLNDTYGEGTAELSYGVVAYAS